jgi:hypothetical protein
LSKDEVLQAAMLQALQEDAPLQHFYMAIRYYVEGWS